MHIEANRLPLCRADDDDDDDDIWVLKTNNREIGKLIWFKVAKCGKRLKSFSNKSFSYLNKIY